MMDLPEDDVGIELMNQKFQEMGVLVETDLGYQVAPEFVARIDEAVRKDHPDADVNGDEYRAAVLDELSGMGVPAGFEPLIANWVIHDLRSRDWDDE